MNNNLKSYIAETPIDSKVLKSLREPVDESTLERLEAKYEVAFPLELASMLHEADGQASTMPTGIFKSACGWERYSRPRFLSASECLALRKTILSGEDIHSPGYKNHWFPFAGFTYQRPLASDIFLLDAQSSKIYLYSYREFDIRLLAPRIVCQIADSMAAFFAFQRLLHNGKIIS